MYRKFNVNRDFKDTGTIVKSCKLQRQTTISTIPPFLIDRAMVVVTPEERSC